MKIVSIRRRMAPGAEARFDIQITDQIRLNGLLLTKNAIGAYRVRAPRNSGVDVAYLHPSLAERITQAALAALEAADAGS